MLNLKKYLQARIKFIKSDIDYANKENVIRNMYACYELADALSMLGDLPLGTLDQMSDIRDTLKAFGKNDVQIIFTATNIDVKPINAGGDFE